MFSSSTEGWVGEGRDGERLAYNFLQLGLEKVGLILPVGLSKPSRNSGGKTLSNPS